MEVLGDTLSIHALGGSFIWFVINIIFVHIFMWVQYEF